MLLVSFLKNSKLEIRLSPDNKWKTKNFSRQITIAALVWNSLPKSRITAVNIDLNFSNFQF
ncbi:hypothetical protein B6A10_12515 [Flavobacterium sp. L1I52]|uniref:Transposase n=1 Tax=Flavobacterium pokkalii TaxID=1940408 RepID=A0ABR7UVV3_9FLAO|nr:hypothetical protein [Flavobacterium pokkalii]